MMVAVRRGSTVGMILNIISVLFRFIYYFPPICIPFIAGGTCFKYLSACSKL